MPQDIIELEGVRLRYHAFNTIIIGSGAAALNAAVSLFDLGQRDIAVVTDRWGGGTSNNTGSDKQTYYKLSLSGDAPDSPLEMAGDLSRGGCMHGDIALCEALNSVQAFFHLVNLGVPFPHDRFGAYVGYKTDHDPRARATSAGPLTSHLMFAALARAVKEREIPVFDRHEVVVLLTSRPQGGEKRVIGAVALDHSRAEEGHPAWVVFNAVNVILGTGGPAGMYRASVYPRSQTGSTGLALAAGAVAQNLTESQFGLASTKFRWNLSGTYQQVIPRYLSTNAGGGDPQEFMNGYFPDMRTLSHAIFLKGYQWPFDPRKIRDYGSSLIDVLVHRETNQLGRRVFLDYTRNPSGAGVLDDFSLDRLAPEPHDYLERSGALLPTPIARLKQMNQPAVDLYLEHGIDISREWLEIAVCNQHNNGGLKGNIWWESNLKHLFPVGEVNGSHGVYRPGGSALNSGQVGSLRAALFIARRYHDPPPELSRFREEAGSQIEQVLSTASVSLGGNAEDDRLLEDIRREIQERMTSQGGHIRDPQGIRPAVEAAWRLWERTSGGMRVSSHHKLREVFKVRDLCLTHAVYLEAIDEYLQKGGRSRGSFLVKDAAGETPCPALGDDWRYRLNPEDAFVDRMILEVVLDERMRVDKRWVEIRPIPERDTWFETVWNAYRQDEIVK